MNFRPFQVFGLASLFVGAMGREFYLVSRVVEGFDVSAAKNYVVDASPIGKNGIGYTTNLQDTWEHQTVFSPRNGDVVKAVPVKDHPNFIMVQNGLYLQVRVCGQELVKQI